MLKKWLIGIVIVIFLGIGIWKWYSHTVSLKLDAYIEKQGIPLTEIYKSKLYYNVLMGWFEKSVWTKQDNDDDVYYTACYNYSKKYKKFFFTMEIRIQNAAYAYPETNTEKRELQKYLTERNMKNNYYPR